jgi:acyl-CoA thioester hydrolase
MERHSMADERPVTYRGVVYPSQCDHMGHMNVMWYVQKFDEATWQLLAAVGLTGKRMRDESSGMAAVEQHIEYRRELRAGDTVTIRSHVMEVKDKAIRFVHEMTDDLSGTVAAVTTLVGVHIDAVARRGRALPPDVREKALALCDRAEARG